MKNEGTVTLKKLTVVDVRGNMICEEPASGLLGQGEEYECRGSTQVRMQNLASSRPRSVFWHSDHRIFGCNERAAYTVVGVH